MNFHPPLYIPTRYVLPLHTVHTPKSDTFFYHYILSRQVRLFFCCFFFCSFAHTFFPLFHSSLLFYFHLFTLFLKFDKALTCQIEEVLSFLRLQYSALARELSHISFDYPKSLSYVCVFICVKSISLSIFCGLTLFLITFVLPVL